MAIRAGIVWISGFGGGEIMRLIANHPKFDLVYAAGDGSAGSTLSRRFVGVPLKYSNLMIEKFDPVNLPPLDLLFASLPTGASREVLSHVPASVKIVDIGGDHRYFDGWTYGLADIWPDEVKGKSRIANPGCFPAATLIALAPLLVNGLIEPANIIIDGKTGISGAGRGGGDNKFGFAESNENVQPYGLLNHVHMPEIAKTIEKLTNNCAEGLVFTPHLIPMTRGILVTLYCRGQATSEECLEAARQFYADRAHIRICSQPPQSKWASGSNLAFVHYASDPKRNLVIAIAAIDNLGKGAAGQAVQNANLMFGFDESLGLGSAPIWP